MQEIVGKVAVVTGAASGIGLGIAQAFAGAGLHLVLADIDADRLSVHADALAARGVSALAVTADVGDPEAVRRLAEAAFERFGAVHVLVNNAGVFASGKTWELPLLEWQRVLQVNLWGAIHGIHEFVPRMLEQRDECHVINVGSMASVNPVPMIGPYNVAKHGLLALTEALAAELENDGRSDIAVTLLMPGRVATRLGGAEPDPAVMSPEELGNSVVQVLRDRPLFHFTHPERVPEVRRRFDRILEGQG